MTKVVPTGARYGEIAAPPSKSDAHRALICAAISNAPTKISIHNSNDDIVATVNCLTEMGADVQNTGDVVYVTPIEQRCSSPLLDCGESGTTLRFMLPLAAIASDNPRFKGHGRLPERPITSLLFAMNQNGCTSSSYKLPLMLSGKLRSGVFELPGNISSQFISGLLLALPLCKGNSKIMLTSSLESASYIEMTISTLSRFGVKVVAEEGSYSLTGGKKLKSPLEYSVEGDWSSAAFYYALSAMGGDVKVSGLSHESVQPDRAIVSLLSELPDVVDISASPDIFPVLAVYAASLQRPTRFVGIERLRMKESDRIMSTSQMILSLGGECTFGSSSMTVMGTGRLRGGAVDSFDDHRIAMSAAVAAAICDEPVTVLHAEAVNKSYPNFWEDFESLAIENFESLTFL